jgi:Tol biopolymer transport system component
MPRFRPTVLVLCALLVGALPAARAVHDEDADLPLTGHTDSLRFEVERGSWVSVDVTPEGEAVVFDLLGDLYRLPIDGGEAERITAGLGFDAQPVISPDGTRIVFVSDRDGSTDLWIADVDGNDARALTEETHASFISPTWTPDGDAVVATRRSGGEVELRLYHVDGGSGVTLTTGSDDGGPEGVGAAVSPDGRFVYYAAEGGRTDSPTDDFPVTQVFRLDLDSGATRQVTRAEGGAFRPVLSPDGRRLVYGSRHDTITGLRVRDLETGDDRWLAWPVQRDAQENFRPPSRGVLPGYAFTPDGDALYLVADGRFQRIALADGARTTIPFTATVDLDIGPDLTRTWRVPEGPLTATLVQDPDFTPDGEAIVASVLTRLYAMDAGGGTPRALTGADLTAYEPAVSPDGRWVAFVSWSAADGGHVWKVRTSGRGRPQRLSEHAAFFTDLVWSPDGETLWALRGNEWMRNRQFSEFTGLDIPLDLVRLPADGGAATVVMAAGEAREPHFGPDPERIWLHEDGTLFSVDLDGGDRRDHATVTGAGNPWYASEPEGAEAVFVSPDGRHALAHVEKQLWVVPLQRIGGTPLEIDVGAPALPATRITDIGADFLGWRADGDIVWAIGSTVFHRPVDSIDFREEEEEKEASEGETEDEDAEPFVPADEHEAVTAVRFAVTVPRDPPEGSLLLRGGHVIAMAGATTDEMAEVRRDHDVLIRGNRIAAIGPTGTLEVDADTEVMDVAGRFLVPGFIDTHAHWEFRTGDVLEPHNWSVVANLAYGVTSGLDVQTSYHDYFAYRDLIDAGLAVGQRAFMTGPGIFGSTDFQSYDEAHAYLRRYADHYRTPNIKAYLSGNRQQRQWVVLASQDLGLLPTTEGGGDQKLDLTHAIDGMHGNEHNLPDIPIFEDVVELYARTATAYTPTLIVQYNAPSMREWFFTREELRDDPKLRRFYPANRLDELTERRPGWVHDDAFRFREGAAAAAAIQRAGGLVGVGGHAELQGLGYHYEMWAYAAGGMTPAEVLRAATIDGAHILGAPDDLGSLEAGKLADLVVLEANPLEDIRATAAIDRVIQDGRVRDGERLDQLWPEAEPLPPFWWWDRSDRRNVPPGTE